MSKITKYGVIGGGMMGQEHLRNIALLPDTKVIGLFEPDECMAKKATEFAPDATLCNSIEDLLALSELDCLVIVSPNHIHLEQLETIAETRPLPILVEKPLFTDPKTFGRVLRFQENYPAPIWVAMEYRYMPPITALCSSLHNAIGDVKMLTIREHRFPFLPKVGDWNRFNAMSGGTFVEKCCHFFDLMRLITKSEPTRIVASAGQDVNHLDENYSNGKPDVLDNGYVIVEFENGIRSMLELCMFAEGSRYQEEVSVIGPDGKIEAHVPGPARFWPDHLGSPPVPKVVISKREPKGPETQQIPVDPTLLDAGDHNGSTFYQHEGFLELVRGNRNEADVTLEDGWKAVVMGMAAQKSAASGHSVIWSEFMEELSNC
ncbi:Gfo/Idh/MocA family oxidoreductase [Lentilitoribacter sp. Alg239-R112]|uniref:Gfo/Idh/MocA family protein n=1 Tax=Lentilitoribacter sp. Alg239-R112 TaxID=2305987 RepID=UPI0013A70360|nr:Gfo/Idh/MocA family oxidoreductase [Lentilitoribacter sp. Alg239-R112]